MVDNILIKDNFPGLMRSTDKHKTVFYCLKGDLVSSNDIVVDLDSYLVVQGNITVGRDVITNETVVVSGSVNSGRNIVGDLSNSSIMVNKDIIAKGHIQAKELISKEGNIESGTYIYTRNNIKALGTIFSQTFIRSKKISSKSIKTITLKCNDASGDTSMVTNISSDIIDIPKNQGKK